MAAAASGGSSPECGAWSNYGGGFYTNVGSGWTSLAIRQGPCRAANAVGTFGIGYRWYVDKQTNGEFICRGSWQYGYGTDVWYRNGTSRWSWAGGTADPAWETHHSC